MPGQIIGVQKPVLFPVPFVETLLVPAIAAAFGLRLLGPSDDWLPRPPEQLRKREVCLMPLRSPRNLLGLAFIKPPNDKSFPARVWRGGRPIARLRRGGSGARVGGGVVGEGVLLLCDQSTAICVVGLACEES